MHHRFSYPPDGSKITGAPSAIRQCLTNSDILLFGSLLNFPLKYPALFPISQPMYFSRVYEHLRSTTVRLSHVLRLLTAKRVLNSRGLSVKSQNNSITYVFYTISTQTLKYLFFLSIKYK